MIAQVDQDLIVQKKLKNQVHVIELVLDHPQDDVLEHQKIQVILVQCHHEKIH